MKLPYLVRNGNLSRNAPVDDPSVVSVCNVVKARPYRLNQTLPYRSTGVIGPKKGGTMEQPQPPQPLQPRKLYRSESNRMVAGVCGGLAEYFNVDATLIRVLFVVLTVFGGAGLVLYLLMWIIVPKPQ